jgi:hypothetical protein
MTTNQPDQMPVWVPDQKAVWVAGDSPIAQILRQPARNAAGNDPIAVLTRAAAVSIPARGGWISVAGDTAFERAVRDVAVSNAQTTALGLDPMLRPAATPTTTTATTSTSAVRRG